MEIYSKYIVPILFCMVETYHTQKNKKSKLIPGAKKVLKKLHTPMLFNKH